MVSADSSQCAVRAYRGPLKKASEYITIHRTHCSILTPPPHVCVRVPEGRILSLVTLDVPQPLIEDVRRPGVAGRVGAIPKLAAEKKKLRTEGGVGAREAGPLTVWSHVARRARESAGLRLRAVSVWAL